MCSGRFQLPLKSREEQALVHTLLRHLGELLQPSRPPHREATSVMGSANHRLNL